ncbi:MAG: alpha/beta hydrolase, partial [Planctomycetota bacterium]
ETDPFMPLHPQAQAFLDVLAAQGAPCWEHMSPDEGRALFASLTDLFGPAPGVDRVEDLTLAGGVPCRLYAPTADQTLPAIMYFHGGGWVLGDLETHDALCRRIANASQCAVVSVHYRRPPEHRFPAALDDCYAATADVAANATTLGVDAQRIAVAGDSAGGNLAATVALKARDAGGPAIHSQWLIYPVIEPNFESPSYQQCAEGYGLTRQEMTWFWQQYLGDQVGRPPALAAPIRAESLGDLPRAHVLTAEFDVLRDEGEAYAERLGSAGVPVELRRYEGLIHGFIHFVGALAMGIEATSELGARMAEELRR